MSNLFIIGNGFDVSHHLPTKYVKFKKFLCEIVNDRIYEDNEELPIIKETPELPIQQVYTSHRKLGNLYGECNFLYWLINKYAYDDLDWEDFEESLGKIDYNELLNEYKNEDDVVSRLTGTLGTLEEVFFEWVSQIKILDNIKPKEYLKEIIIPDSDLAISFNYTETMETVYGLKKENVCYIHGKREANEKVRIEKQTSSFGKDNVKLIVGCDNSEYHPCAKDRTSFESNKISKLITLETYMQKDSEAIIRRNQTFFDKIINSNIENIYSYGFSYSNVDKPQLRAICDALNMKYEKSKNMIWYLNEFDEKPSKSNKNISQNEEFKEKIRECQFKGAFAIYNSDKECKLV